jgi:tRNA G18 (ribose-2'-O)-methylase SpoU
MRTCDALGFELVFVGYTPRPEGKTLPMVIKTSIGAEKTVAWKYFQHPQEVFAIYPDIDHYGIEINNKSEDILEYCNKHLPKEGSYLWFGNEISGLSDLVESTAKTLLHLPMKGTKESLNVATSVTAAGYILASFATIQR